jgi:hypothetical protein
MAREVGSDLMIGQHPLMGIILLTVTHRPWGKPIMRVLEVGHLWCSSESPEINLYSCYIPLIAFPISHFRHGLGTHVSCVCHVFLIF